jgi:hypothetical protein
MENSVKTSPFIDKFLQGPGARWRVLLLVLVVLFVIYGSIEKHFPGIYAGIVVDPQTKNCSESVWKKGIWPPLAQAPKTYHGLPAYYSQTSTIGLLDFIGGVGDSSSFPQSGDRPLNFNGIRTPYGICTADSAEECCKDLQLKFR